MNNFFMYLFVMSSVTYLIRMVPLVLVKKKIKNRYVLSFLHYIPYAVLTVMTVPAMFYSASTIPAIAGFIVAVIFAFFEKSLTVVALAACLTVFLTDIISKGL